jgi:hypothetical protein
MPPIARPPGLLTHEELLENVNYDPLTGVSVWLKPGPRRQVGGVVGQVRESTGYRECTVCGEFWYHSRLAWFYVTGKRPNRIVDHKNLIRSDDWFNNLRLATYTQNSINSERYGNMQGISKRDGYWRVRLSIMRNRITIGNFVDLQEAIEARNRIYSQTFGEFFRHGS